MQTAGLSWFFFSLFLVALSLSFDIRRLYWMSNSRNEKGYQRGV